MIIDWLDRFVILFCELKVEWFSQTKNMMMMRRVLMFVICWTFSHGSLPKDDDLDLVNVRATPNLHDYNLHRWICYVPLFGSCDKTIVKLTLYILGKFICQKYQCMLQAYKCVCMFTFGLLVIHQSYIRLQFRHILAHYLIGLFGDANNQIRLL